MTKDNLNKKYIDITKDGYQFKVVENDLSKWGDDDSFWNRFVSSSWEPFTLNWVREYSDPNKSFLDIGGWIGPIALWASNFNKTVHTFEPDPVAFESLEMNIANCKNIIAHNAAVTSENISVNLFSRNGLGSSMTSMYTGTDSGLQAKGYSFSDAIKLDDFGLIKIDIEGGERLLIDTLVDNLVDNPINLIFSFHHGFYQNPDKDFEYILNGLSKIYSKFILDDGNQVSLEDVPLGFATLFCSKE